MATYAWDEVSDSLVETNNPIRHDEYWELTRTDGPVLSFRSSRGHVAVEITAPSRSAALSLLVRQPEYTALYGKLTSSGVID